MFCANYSTSRCYFAYTFIYISSVCLLSRCPRSDRSCLQAVELLRPGGVLVYSTCTVTLAENEEQVAWALETFPSLQLQHQVRTVAALSG